MGQGGERVTERRPRKSGPRQVVVPTSAPEGRTAITAQTTARTPRARATGSERNERPYVGRAGRAARRPLGGVRAHLNGRPRAECRLSLHTASLRCDLDLGPRRPHGQRRTAPARGDRSARGIAGGDTSAPCAAPRGQRRVVDAPQDLGCLLAPKLGIQLRRVGSCSRRTSVYGEKTLSSWMEAHAFVSFVAHDRPWELEDQLIAALDLPLNLEGSTRNAFHDELTDVRRRAVAVANELPAVLNPGVGGR